MIVDLDAHQGNGEATFPNPFIVINLPQVATSSHLSPDLPQAMLGTGVEIVRKPIPLAPLLGWDGHPADAVGMWQSASTYSTCTMQASTRGT